MSETRARIDMILKTGPIETQKLEKLIIVAFVSNADKVVVKNRGQFGLLAENGETNQYIEAHQSDYDLEFVPFAEFKRVATEADG